MLNITFPNSWTVLGNYVLVFLALVRARAPFGADVHTLIVNISEPGRLHLVGSYLKMKHLHVCVHKICYSNVWLGLIRSW